MDDFFLLLDTDEHFRTIYELNVNRDIIANSVLLAYNSVPDELQDNVIAVKLLDLPADYDTRFPSTIQELLSQVPDSFDKPLYYQSAWGQPFFSPGSFNFISGRAFAQSDSSDIPERSVLMFTPSENVTESLKTLENILNQSLSYPESIVIIPSAWFFEREENQEAFSQILQSYLNGESISFAMPSEGQANPQVNWPIIILLLIWVSFIVHYKYQPMYKSTLPRYFFNHSFFVHDVMEQRIRSGSSGFIVLFQHALLTGFFFYLLADAFVTNTGLQSLSSHFPVLIYTGFEELCLFVIGFSLALLSHIISILWLRIINKSIKQVGQVINLYCWPLHLNLIIITFVVYFLQISAGTHWLIFAVGAYFLVWFFSFTIAAIDGAKFLEKYRTLNLFLTVGLHFLLIATGVILIFVLPFIFEALQMAVLLP